MKWATEALIHFDRVVSAWLIVRLIDPDAEFTFLTLGDQATEGAILFGLPDAPLAAHRGGSTTFQRILNAYSLTDPALIALAQIVADVVSHVMQDTHRAQLTQRHEWTGGVLAVAEGIMLLSASDAECLDRSLPIYDALYARLQAAAEMQKADANSTQKVLEKTLRFAHAVRHLRKRAEQFSPPAFQACLSAVRGTLRRD
jgi:hypothetical protein